MTVHLHCVESFGSLLQRCRRGRGCSELWKNTIFPEHSVYEVILVNEYFFICICINTNYLLSVCPLFNGRLLFLGLCSITELSPRFMLYGRFISLVYAPGLTISYMCMSYGCTSMSRAAIYSWLIFQGCVPGLTYLLGVCSKTELSPGWML